MCDIPTVGRPGVLAPVLRLGYSIVDCWIGIGNEGDRRVIRLAGRLTSAQVPELLTACGDGGPLDVDLADLINADAAGIEALQRIRAAGVRLLAAPGYIQLKLDSASQPAPRTSPARGT